MAEQYGVRLTLILKADSDAEARQLALRKVANALNGWMQEDRTAPFPRGSLLYWEVSKVQQLRPAEG